MPISIQGSNYGNQTAVLVESIDYDYPFDLDLQPDSPLHQKLVRRVLDRAEDSWRVMSQRHDAWRKIDETLTAYIPTTTYEKALKSRPEAGQSLHPQTRPTSIVVPNSFAAYETLMTYVLKALLMGTVHQYEGTASEYTLGAKLLEIVVNQQVKRFKSVLDLYTSAGDSFKYGIGPMTFKWHEEYGKRLTTRRVSGVIDLPGGQGQEDILITEGNKLIPLDPYRFMPDPNVSIHRIQDGEFVGWTEKLTYFKLLETERDDASFFNVRYLNHSEIKQRSSKYDIDQSHRQLKHGQRPSETQTLTTNYITVIYMFIHIIPKEWGLPGDDYSNPTGEYPEKWLFTVANDSILLQAARLNLMHNRYPVAVNAPDFDGHSITPISRIEMLAGLQDALNWLFNSHIANVRKAMNDMLIVDPSLIVMKDLQNPEPGKLVRIRRKAWGKGTKDAVQQLVVNDVTRQNIGDSVYIADVMQRVSAAVDAVQGVVRSGGERRSATEYKSTVTGALSRLEKIAYLTDVMFMSDVAFFSAAHTQQFMSREVFTRSVGAWPDELRRIYQPGEDVTIYPDDINVGFDILVKDGTTVTSGSESVDVWANIFQTIGTNELLMQQFDVPRIFLHIAQMLGAKNIFDFIAKGGDTNAAVAPDPIVQEAVQAGRLKALPNFS